MKSVNLIIVGFGTIGKGVLEVLRLKHRHMKDRYGADLRVKAVCEINGSLVNEKGIDTASALRHAERGRLKSHPDWRNKRSLEVMEELDADIVLELTPGNVKTGEPGLSHILKAFDCGRNVITSNKAPIALRFQELTAEAERKGLFLGYEATVGGAIPLINLYRDNLGINEISSIYGILNGTSNFILTKMFEEDLSLETALKEAQELGIAERDPGYDIGGIDTAVKLVILANSLMGRKVSYKDVNVSGIQEVTLEALELAKKHGYAVKLIGDVNDMAVSPRLVPLNHSLNVSGTLNAVMLETDIAGTLTLVGHGAGKIETSSSVFSDILTYVRSRS
ncbi:MAG: homoserine dehydrogenase [Candidatus Altiarchaeota archaeon]|nr:homoserine dehydrogenase [Candidatus Altiarchaeota archaeon]